MKTKDILSENRYLNDIENIIKTMIISLKALNISSIKVEQVVNELNKSGYDVDENFVTSYLEDSTDLINDIDENNINIKIDDDNVEDDEDNKNKNDEDEDDEDNKNKNDEDEDNDDNKTKALRSIKRKDRKNKTKTSKLANLIKKDK